jgi:hypothetical protein
MIDATAGSTRERSWAGILAKLVRGCGTTISIYERELRRAADAYHEHEHLRHQSAVVLSEQGFSRANVSRAIYNKHFG